MRVGLLPRRQTMRPVPISASARSSATHTGKPVKGSVPPATFATLPSTPFAGFDLLIVAFAPSTPPAFCDGEAFDELCVAGAVFTAPDVTGATVTGAGV